MRKNMKPYFSNLFRKPLLLLSMALVSVHAVHAQSADPRSQVAVTHLAEIESVVKDKEGKSVVKRQPAVKVAPGGTVIYTTRLENQGSQEAGDLNLVAPVPPNTTLVANGTFGETTPLYSVDQGKTFGPLANLIVDKEGRQRPARLADVTHLRWQPQKPLPAGAKSEVGFKVQVN
jgi:uncharacterized repeat protein (TIGR01451 family)